MCFPVVIDVKQQNIICIMQGLEWVMQMYTSGVCSDYRYIYDARTPLLKELIDCLRSESPPEALDEQVRRKACFLANALAQCLMF